MAITPTAYSSLSSKNFADFVYDLLRGKIPIDGVRFEGESKDFYNTDGAGVPTVGVGTALLIRNSSNQYIIRGDLDNLFEGVHTFSTDARAALSDVANILNDTELTQTQRITAAEEAFDDALGNNLFPPLSDEGMRTVYDRVLQENLNIILNDSSRGIGFAYMQQ